MRNHKSTFHWCFWRTAVIAAGLVALGNSSSAQTYLGSGHGDIGILYADGAWDLHVHDGEKDIEYTPDQVTLGVGAAGATLVPSAPSFSFLGAAGSMVYILPQSENPELLFLGIGTEEQALGMFVDDRISLRLEGFSGPGHFSLYKVNQFGVPASLMNSRDGISAADLIELQAGGHAHANWAFSELGEYKLTFRASGFLNDGLDTFTQSDPITYTFSVPEPSAAALIALGAGLMLWRRNRQKA